MTIAIPDNRVLTLAAKDGGGFQSAGLVGTGPVIPSANYFEDNFESGDWNKQRPGGGNFWQTMDLCSVVTKSSGTSTVIYNGSVINVEVNDGRDWTAKVGDNCLRVRYNAGQNDNAKAQWSIRTADAMPRIYVAFWVRVPVNFRKFGTNNKFFWMWMDGRSDQGNGSTVGMEFRGTDSANWYCKVGAGSAVVGGDQQSSSFISYPSDQGRWMEVCIFAEAESSPGADDGLMKVWRRWENESDFTNTHNLSNQPIKLPDNPADPQGFAECEMMGYPNGAYQEDTEWLFNHVRISSDPLVPAGTEGL